MMTPDLAHPVPYSPEAGRHLPRRPGDAAETCRPRTFVARLDSRTESTPLARYLLRAYLAGLPSGDRYRDTAELLLTELFANAVQHSDAPDDCHIEIHMSLADSRLRLEVHDADTNHPVLRTPTPADEHGRGLFLVDELAERWGCAHRPGGIGKFIWALIAPVPASTLA
ncbi:ATP-binding protein [Kitasatospora sp. NPDC091335]|uniref:ATP-binding protein n=1 Tax=Kitasatospora sp. NPDC091335 TaxID=3364085 RepID=UPI0038109F79